MVIEFFWAKLQNLACHSTRKCTLKNPNLVSCSNNNIINYALVLIIRNEATRSQKGNSTQANYKVQLQMFENVGYQLHWLQCCTERFNDDDWKQS